MNGKKVLVAMSGGVDSSVTAAILKEKGYDVIGITMQIWSQDREDEETGGCCSLSAINDARKVAYKLGIPFYVLNFRELFEEKVINYFTDEYMRGRTPNPCIACNRYIKFEALLNKARAIDADFVATGHYARIKYDKKRGRYLLLTAEDKNKDQTYALYSFKQNQLARTLMPLGDFKKSQIREKAAHLGLAVADKPESQEICFVTDNNYRGFLAERVPPGKIKPGPFLTTSGKKVGTHKGLPFYTIGQRRGLGLALGYPVYVVALNPGRNAVIVGTEDEIYAPGLIAVDNNFISMEELKEPMKVTAKIRYSSPPAPAIIENLPDKRVRVRFERPQRAITPGQSVVYYQGPEVVGGGIIDKVVYN